MENWFARSKLDQVCFLSTLIAAWLGGTVLAPPKNWQPPKSGNDAPRACEKPAKRRRIQMRRSSIFLALFALGCAMCSAVGSDSLVDDVLISKTLSELSQRLGLAFESNEFGR